MAVVSLMEYTLFLTQRDAKGCAKVRKEESGILGVFNSFDKCYSYRLSG